MNKLWFTSDLHFYHKSINRFCPNTRTGQNALEMNEDLINTWNEQVADEDEVYILGDVSFSGHDRARLCLERLKGKKHIILGNHDKIKIYQGMRDILESVEYYKTLKLEGRKVILFHYPIFEWDAMSHGSFHLHGHTHGLDINMGEGRYLDVGIDTRPDYKLYSWEEVKSILENKPILSRRGRENE